MSILDKTKLLEYLYDLLEFEKRCKRVSTNAFMYSNALHYNARVELLSSIIKDIEHGNIGG